MKPDSGRAVRRPLSVRLNLFQKFNPDKDCSHPKAHSKRLDYTYVKQQGEGWRLIPKDAHVIRDWTYE